MAMAMAYRLAEQGQRSSMRRGNSLHGGRDISGQTPTSSSYAVLRCAGVKIWRLPHQLDGGRLFYQRELPDRDASKPSVNIAGR